METSVPGARAIHQYIHCGSSCGYPGGCNNKSPLSHQNFFRVEKVPAVAVFRLWRQNPTNPAAPADMTFTIDMN